MAIKVKRSCATAPKPTESQEQKAVIKWWDSYARTKGLDPRLLFASANGAHLAGDASRRAIAMRSMKAQGLRVGVPDLMLAVPKWHVAHVLFAGLFVEMKRRDHASGKPAPAQLEYANLLRRMGYNAVICEGADEAIRAIRGYIES